MQQNMQKNRIIIILLAVAFACSVLAGFLIWSYMTPSRATIYVFNGDYSEGEAVTADILTPVQVDASIVSGGREDSVDSYMVTSAEYSDIIRSGEYLRMDVTEGMPLTTGMLSVQGGSTLEMNMTSNSIAISFPVDQFTGVTNSLKVGSRVNIYSVINSEVRLIQQNKRIIEVFTSDGAISGVAVEESIYESMELIYAIKYGSIYLGLVDASGYQASEGSDPVYTEVEEYYYADEYEETEAEASTNTVYDDDYYLDEYDSEEIAEAAEGLGLDVYEFDDTEETETETSEDISEDTVFVP